MGTDSTAKLIFGIVLTYDEFRRVLLKYSNDQGDNDNNSNDGELFERFINGEIDISRRYKSLYLEITYPYYDASSEDWIFYVGIRFEDKLHDRTITDDLTIEDLKKLSTIDTEEFTKFLVENSLKIQQPKLIAVVHVN